MYRSHASSTLSRIVLCLSMVVALLLMTLLAAPAPAGAWSDGAPASLVLGQVNFNSSSFTTTQSGMYNPTGAAIDPSTGAVFIVDSFNHRVLRFASLVALSNGANANGVLGQIDFTSNTIATTRSGMFDPTGAVVDGAGRLWVADNGNNRVLRFDAAASKPNGANADGVLGQGDFTSSTIAITQSGMYSPVKVALDIDGRLWVTDRGNNRVLRFDGAASKAIGAPADGVLGQVDFTSRSHAATQSGMYWPLGVAVDAAGRLWVVDGNCHRVLRFDGAASKPNGANADGVLGQVDFTSNIIATTQSGMQWPEDVAVDGSGRLWVADYGNNRVLRFDGAASKPNGANADGVLGQVDFTSSSPAATQSGMYRPLGVAVDGSGRLWVADFGNNRVVLFQDQVLVQITRGGASPTRAASLAYQVRFDGPVSGLTASNFSLTTTGTISGASVNNVESVTPSLYTVTVDSGAGDGTIRLDLANTTGLEPATVLPAVPYTGGEAYTIDKTAPGAPGIDMPSDNNFITNLRPAIGGGVGAAEANATVTVKEGDVTLCTAVVSTDGSWSCTPAIDLGTGRHTLSAVQADLAGNTSLASTHIFTIGLRVLLPVVRCGE